jgi:hypothetical protein
MKFVFSVLTAFWAGLAAPTLLPAEGRAEPCIPPQVQERKPHELAGLSFSGGGIDNRG